jgi:acyl-CoA-binding protein
VIASNGFSFAHLTFDRSEPDTRPSSWHGVSALRMLRIQSNPINFPKTQTRYNTVLCLLNMPTQTAVKDVFDQIIRWIHETPATPDIETSIHDKLHLYGLYKHVTEGTCGSGDPPSIFYVKTHAMYEAHAACRHLSTEQAMLEYVQLVASQPTWFGRKCRRYLHEQGLLGVGNNISNGAGAKISNKDVPCCR